MLKRIHIYLKEMYPVIPRLFLGFLLLFEVYFLVVLIADVKDIRVGIQEIVGAFTIFAFLMSLRIADEFKDYETDLKLFPERPYPSGRVRKTDLIVLLVSVSAVAAALNVLFMNNPVFFAILVGYAVLMSVWFFSRHRIQKSLLLALVTHNPVQLVLNLYIISFACIKYGLPIFTFDNVVIAFTLYFPGLIWEVSRKIRAPEDETEYVTYSKIFGYKKATRFVMLVMFFDMITSSILVFKLYPWAVITVILSYGWLVYMCRRFMDDPARFQLVKKVELYEYVTESTVILIEVLFLFERFVL
jgi:4-hydroxybenzoate polyprenyltransferase